LQARCTRAGPHLQRRHGQTHGRCTFGRFGASTSLGSLEGEEAGPMSETRTQLRHAYERMVTAEIEDVWRALTDPDERQQAYYDNVVESTWMPGEPVRYLDADGRPMIEGTVVDVDAPHRLVHTFTFTSHAEADAAGDAPSTVTWALEPGDDGTHVSLVHDGFTSQNATWRAVEEGWDQILDGLVDLFDEGE
jgi:uncharacterized protein YndB with AHSA1/START domain